MYLHVHAELPDTWRHSREHLLTLASQAKRTMREADTNGDGKVSKEEFVHLLLGSPVSDSLDQYDARITRQ